LIDEVASLGGPQRKGDLTENWILEKAGEYKRKHNRWPVKTSGPIEGADETWMGIDSALRDGRRGLPGGSTLSKFLGREKSDLTIEWVEG
jgi:hypothetical protein